MTLGLAAVAGDIWLLHSLYSNLHKCNLIIICDHAFVGAPFHVYSSNYRFSDSQGYTQELAHYYMEQGLQLLQAVRCSTQASSANQSIY